MNSLQQGRRDILKVGLVLPLVGTSVSVPSFAHARQESRIRSFTYRATQAELEAASATDIDGAMKPIADDIISYEHEAPLQYIGIDNVREVRKERGSWLVQHEHHSFTHTS